MKGELQMKQIVWILTLSLALTLIGGGKSFAQAKKEMTFSGTHYFSSTPKIFRLGPDQIIMQAENLGVRVNDSGDGPFHGTSVHIVLVSYRSKEYNGNRGYVTWIDKDGDKVIWELLDALPGASSSPGRMIAATGKYVGWQGTIEYTMQFPRPFPEGTGRGICRENIKLILPQ
jgi:hypothetical protein